MTRRAWVKQPDTDRRLSGWAWQQLRARWLAEHPLCVRCEAKGRTVVATSLDHILPRSQGGTDDASNLQGLCATCHTTKTITDRGYRQRPRIGPDGYPVRDDD